jgi:hypothetical protein
MMDHKPSGLLAKATFWSCCIALSTGLHGYADTFTIQELAIGIRIPFVRIVFLGADGKPVELGAIIDSGNGGGIGMNQATADRLGLTVTGQTETTGVGTPAGGSTTLPTVNISPEGAGQIQEVTTPPGQAQTSLSVSGKGVIMANLPDSTVVLGQDFLAQFGEEKR